MDPVNSPGPTPSDSLVCLPTELKDAISAGTAHEEQGCALQRCVGLKRPRWPQSRLCCLPERGGRAARDGQGWETDGAPRRHAAPPGSGVEVGQCCGQVARHVQHAHDLRGRAGRIVDQQVWKAANRPEPKTIRQQVRPHPAELWRATMRAAASSVD